MEIRFSDLLNHLDQALDTEDGEQLANEIYNHYSVIMIDEFQDTASQ
ncbi:MAG: UvrD-helicase domain-containing protein [Arsenophonus sp. NC-XBC3-MAG3]